MKKTLSNSAIPILGLLTWRPMSGYEIKSNIEETVGYFWSESYGQLYPQLNKLLTASLIEEVEHEDTGKRKKRVYAITDEGRAALGDWIEKEPVSRPQRNELLLKIFFTSSSDSKANLKHCIRAHDEAVSTLASYKVVEKHLDELSIRNPDAVYWKMTLDLGIAETKTFIEWSEKAIQLFKTTIEKEKL